MNKDPDRETKLREKIVRFIRRRALQFKGDLFEAMDQLACEIARQDYEIEEEERKESNVPKAWSDGRDLKADFARTRKELVKANKELDDLRIILNRTVEHVEHEGEGC